MMDWQPTLGAILLDDNQCEFRVWSPYAKAVDVHLIGASKADDRYVSMARVENDLFRAVIENVMPGQLYRYRIDDKNEYPDPVSRSQPDGVSGASQVVDRRYLWKAESWIGLPLKDYLIYEIHVGTYSKEGTYQGAIPFLDELVELGVTAIELMPVAQFPGDRGWGYDGVFQFAPQNSYGTPDDFKALIDACHERGLAVILDVVYNHFGPEGNPLGHYAPYTTPIYKGPWGDAVNVDGKYSDEVRAFFIENAFYWVNEFRIDALRLDATHFIYDFSPYTFLEELTDKIDVLCQHSGRSIYLIAEDDRNLAKLVQPRDEGGIGMNAQWLDDFHHSLHTNMIGENFAYYQDFGQFWQLEQTFREGFVYTGQYAPNRKRRHGTSSADIPAERFIVFIQNHDQIGNRMPNDRITKIFSHAQFKLAIGTVLISPYLPMLFMGDEYGESAGFQYFIDYEGKDLLEAVRKGRVETFGFLMPPGTEPPDPGAKHSFTMSKLDHSLRDQGVHRVLFDYHKTLIALRKSIPALSEPNKVRLEVQAYGRERVLYLRRWNGDSEIFAALSFSFDPVTIKLDVPGGKWKKQFDSADPRWNADSDLSSKAKAHTLKSDGTVELTLPPHSFVLYLKNSDE
ncbi:MAG: malto-oligosyltrehalose trehalohydrolase [Chloroflexi bacterium]|nr:malto-oligosyltrehalose trehalohydrolase [Chloroflexota bacterium]